MFDLPGSFEFAHRQLCAFHIDIRAAVLPSFENEAARSIWSEQGVPAEFLFAFADAREYRRIDRFAVERFLVGDLCVAESRSDGVGLIPLDEQQDFVPALRLEHDGAVFL